MPVSHKRKILKHKAKKSSKRSHRNHRNKKTKKSLKNMRGGVLNSNSTFDDIKIGDTFINGETGETLHIYDKIKNDDNYKTATISYRNKDNTSGATLPYDDFILLFKNGTFLSPKILSFNSMNNYMNNAYA